jgi:hypothetical protein
MKKAGDLLQNFLDEKIMKKAKGYSELFSSWTAIAGDQCAAHSRIGDLKGTLLIIEADHPGWVQILQTRQTELLNSIQKRNPNVTITGISFKLSKEPNQTEMVSVSELQQTQIPAEIIPENNEEIFQKKNDTTDLYANIHDEDFKESLKRLEKSIQNRHKK